MVCLLHTVMIIEKNIIKFIGILFLLIFTEYMVKKSEKYSHTFQIISLYHTLTMDKKEKDEIKNTGKSKKKGKYKIYIWINDKLIMKKSNSFNKINAYIRLILNYCELNPGCTIDSFNMVKKTFLLKIIGNKFGHYSATTKQKISFIKECLFLKEKSMETAKLLMATVKNSRNSRENLEENNHYIEKKKSAASCDKVRNFSDRQSFVEVKNTQ